MHQSAQQDEGTYHNRLLIDAHSHWPQGLDGPEGGLETEGPEGCKPGAASIPASGGAIAVRGGAGHVRVWAQWEAGGLTRGCMYGLAAIYQTRSSVKPTILLFAQAQVVVCHCRHFAHAHSLGHSNFIPSPILLVGSIQAARPLYVCDYCILYIYSQYLCAP